MILWGLEKKLFIANVYREAAGKELKLAHSQGCSRLLERLAVLSSPMQLKALLQCFSAQFVSLPFLLFSRLLGWADGDMWWGGGRRLVF